MSGFTHSAVFDWSERSESLVDEYVQLTRAPSVAVGLVDRSGGVQFLCRGHADVTKQIAATPRTLYQVGSITKSLVAILVLQAEREGRLSMDTAVEHYLPWLELGLVEPLTVAKLLTHTSGLRAGTSVGLESQLEARLAVRARARWLSGAPVWPPNTYHYSNIGYDLLGWMLEDVFGKTLRELLAERVFRPLGMDASLGAISYDSYVASARGYRGAIDDSPRLPADPLCEALWEVSTGGAGCVMSNVQDMSRYVSTLLRRGEGLLTQKEFEEFAKPRVATGTGNSYGYGVELMVTSEKPHGVIFHTGGMLGFRCAIEADPTEGRGVVVLTNLGIDHHEHRIGRLATSLLTRAKKSCRTHPEAPALTPEVNADQFIGDYGGPILWRVRSSSASLELTVGNTHAILLPIDADRFLIDDQSLRTFELRFTRDESGQVIGLEHGPTYLMRGAVTANESGPASIDAASMIGVYRSHNPLTPVMRIVWRRGALWAHVSDIVSLVELLGPNRCVLTGTPELIEFAEPSPYGFLSASLSECPFYRVAATGIGA